MFDMNIAWYYQVWCWIGLGAAIVLVILLFTANVLRSDLNKKKWKDPTWLARIFSIAYLLHNVEEYGMDLTGEMYAFAKTMNNMLGVEFSGMFFVAVNISLIWLAYPIAAALSRKFPLMTVGLASLTFINSFMHIGAMAGGGYNSGVFTTLVIFIPASLWTFYVFLGKEKLKFSTLAAFLGIGVLAHILLVGGAFASNVLGAGVTSLLQVVNAALALFLWYAVSKRAKSKQ
jgi:hypothetical protein